MITCQIKIYIIIATSKKRTDLLINRSLKSIYSQRKINIENIEIIIVDDNLKNLKNEFSMEYKTIENSINKLRERFEYKKNQFKTHLLKNTKIQFKSGTGAWNTAIEFIKEQRQNKNSFTAILDDDDEYKNNYLQECIRQINSETYAIFTPIIWKEKEFERIHYIKKEELTSKHFFIGNPGVQGSNMFFKSDILEKIGGFDENLPSTTDRDIMIRFLDYKNNYPNNSIAILNEPLVIHHATGNDRVTNNIILKKEGLDIFYKKYKSRFSEVDFQKSISRAKKLFRYEYADK